VKQSKYARLGHNKTERERDKEKKVTTSPTPLASYLSLYKVKN
jgi:hypothetical protein